MLFLGRKTKRDQTTKRRAEEKVYIWVLLARPQPMTAPPRTPPMGGPGEPLTCGGAGGVQRLRPPAKPPPRGWAGGGLWLLATLKGAFCKEIMRVYGYPTTSSTGTHTHMEKCRTCLPHVESFLFVRATSTLEAPGLESSLQPRAQPFERSSVSQLSAL